MKKAAGRAALAKSWQRRGGAVSALASEQPQQA